MALEDVVCPDNISGSIESEVEVQWVHPGCSFILNQATARVVRESPKAPWIAYITGQRSLASEAIGLSKISQNAEAMEAICQAITQFSRMGTIDPKSLSMVKVSNLHTSLGAEVGLTETQLLMWGR